MTTSDEVVVHDVARRRCAADEGLAMTGTHDSRLQGQDLLHGRSRRRQVERDRPRHEANTSADHRQSIAREQRAVRPVEV